MSRLIVTTTRREVSPNQPSGYIYVVDLRGGKVLQRSEILEAPWRDRDPNPRGGLRGAKGISVRPDQIAIANPSMIFCYDPSWNLLGHISHPSCAAIHDIAFEEDTIWVTSARNDILFQFDLDGQMRAHYDMRLALGGDPDLSWHANPLLSSQEIQDGQLDFRDPSSHQQLDYDRAHVNSVCLLPHGEMLVSLGQLISPRYAFWLRAKERLIALGIWDQIRAINRAVQSGLGLEKDLHSDLLARPAVSDSAVVRFLANGRAEVCLRIQNVTAPCHSLVALKDHSALHLDTTRGSVIHFDPSRQEVISSTPVTDGFLRGMALLDDKLIVIGSNTTLLVYDLEARRVKSRLQISNLSQEAIFDIERLPAHFSLPPTSFRDHLISETGIRPEGLLLGSGKGEHARRENTEGQEQGSER